MSFSAKQYIQTEEGFKDLFDSAHDLIHMADIEGRLFYVNKSWMNLLEYTQEEIQGTSIYSFIEEQDRKRFFEYRQAIINGDSFKKEIVICVKTKSGKRLSLEGFVSAKIKEGKPVYTRGIFRDITAKLKDEAQLKAINEELKEREANLQQLLHYAPDAVIVIDANSTITYWNPKAETIFGWPAAEVCGKSLTHIIIPHQHRVAHDRGMKRYLATGEAHVLNKTIEITALNKQDREFYVSLTISTVHQKGNIAFIAFIRDIDEQKRNALELEHKKIELELSNRELEQFAHVASHDMKEPVRKISIFTELLKKEAADVLSSNAKVLVDKIDSAASRLMNMVDGVLAYSSLNTEVPINVNVNLDAIINSIEEDLEVVIAQKKAVIKRTKLPIIEGAPFLLYQLFYNLFNNSLKFSKPDVPPTIEIFSRNVDTTEVEAYSLNQDVGYVALTIKDNGIGFSQDYAETIFKAFTRLHSKDKYEGTGLGLALCKTIVEKHHGIILANSKENIGAAFTIILPEKQ